jgi:type IV secretory pathway VirB3-like protein
VGARALSSLTTCIFISLQILIYLVFLFLFFVSRNYVFQAGYITCACMHACMHTIHPSPSWLHTYMHYIFLPMYSQAVMTDTLLLLLFMLHNEFIYVYIYIYTHAHNKQILT